MKVVICGSLKHLQEMVDAKNRLLELGYEVELPHSAEKFLKEKDFDETIDAKKKYRYIQRHLEKIRDSDCVLVVNHEKNGLPGYIGGNTLMEMGFALAFNKPIYILNEFSSKLSYTDELWGMLPVILGGSLDSIVDHT